MFPVKHARVIAEQLPDCRGFVTIPATKLFVQEESAGELVRVARPFLLGA